MMAELHRFPGGLALQPRKDPAAQVPIRVAPIPRQLILPLTQHVGLAAEPLVAVGDLVLKGQILARAGGYVSAPVHAPTSGVVSGIGAHPIAHPGGLSAPCIIINSDGRDQWGPRSGIDPRRDTNAATLRELILRAGIVGCGGAGFPTQVKVREAANQGVDTLIINGVECEPYVSCDDRLLQERAEEVVAGARLLARALGGARCVIAIERNMEQAGAALRRADLTDIDVVIVPDIYPAGGEKQLVHAVTGRAVPSGGLTIHAGVLVQNVATAAAVCRAVQYGEPVVSRIVTVAGEVPSPGNFEVRIGTPMQSVLASAGLAEPSRGRLICGGPMMGIEVPDASAPITKTSNCLLLLPGVEPLVPRPCIRCGACDEVCPMRLQARALYDCVRAADFDRAQDLHLFDCIECGCCAYVCPSAIDLVPYYRRAKAVIDGFDRDHDQAVAAARHERHAQRRSGLVPSGGVALLDLPDSSAALGAEIEAALARRKDRP
jgi:electron transport complex protein RnfC